MSAIDNGAAPLAKDPGRGNDMVRVRCPECGTESDVAPQHGAEVVAAYCLRHHGGADHHVRPVYMELVSSETSPLVAELERIAA